MAAHRGCHVFPDTNAHSLGEQPQHVYSVRFDVPRRNGELFDAPGQERVFGMAVALSERGLFPWEDFREALTRAVAAAEARGGDFRYYDAWLAAFESALADRGVVRSRRSPSSSSSASATTSSRLPGRTP